MFVCVIVFSSIDVVVCVVGFVLLSLLFLLFLYYYYSTVLLFLWTFVLYIYLVNACYLCFVKCIIDSIRLYSYFCLFVCFRYGLVALSFLLGEDNSRENL